jgi:opacity protein-like surface antigen
MKTKFNLFAMATLVAFLFAGQKTFAQQGFSFKASAGAQTSWIFNSDDSDVDGFSQKLYLHPAFTLGAGYNFTDNLGLGLDVMYSFQGRKYEIDDVEGRLSMDYLKIPLYFHYNTNSAATWMFSANVGPQIGILTRAKALDSDGNDLGDIKDSYKDMTFGAFASAGTEYKLTDNLNLFGLVRYDFDFSNCEDDEATGYVDGRASSHNSSLGIQLGIRYLLGK